MSGPLYFIRAKFRPVEYEGASFFACDTAWTSASYKCGLKAGDNGGIFVTWLRHVTKIPPEKNNIVMLPVPVSGTGYACPECAFCAPRPGAPSWGPVPGALSRGVRLLPYYEIVRQCLLTCENDKSLGEILSNSPVAVYNGTCFNIVGRMETQTARQCPLGLSD
jgi:hypothetical protein